MTDRQFYERAKQMVETGEKFLEELKAIKLYLELHPSHSDKLMMDENGKELESRLIQIGKQIDKLKS